MKNVITTGMLLTSFYLGFQGAHASEVNLGTTIEYLTVKTSDVTGCGSLMGVRRNVVINRRGDVTTDTEESCLDGTSCHSVNSFNINDISFERVVNEHAIGFACKNNDRCIKNTVKQTIRRNQAVICVGASSLPNLIRAWDNFRIIVGRSAKTTDPFQR